MGAGGRHRQRRDGAPGVLLDIQSLCENFEGGSRAGCGAWQPLEVKKSRWLDKLGTLAFQQLMRSMGGPRAWEKAGGLVPIQLPWRDAPGTFGLQKGSACDRFRVARGSFPSEPPVRGRLADLSRA